MADLSDVTAFLASTVAAIVYPNGTSQPSIVSAPVKIYEGWPLAEQLDRDMTGTASSISASGVHANGVGAVSNISIYPMSESSSQTVQILDEPYVIAAPVHGLTAAVSGQTASFAGAPGAGEFVTIVVDGANVYSRSGATLSAILSGIQSDAAALYPGAAVTSNSITIGAKSLGCRIGAPATVGQATHRQRHSVMVTIWAPDPITRGKLASAIDASIKANYQKVTFPDGSNGLIIYNRTIQQVRGELDSFYRRDLIYMVEYATIETFEAVEVTTVGAVSQSSIVPAGYSVAFNVN